MGQEIVTEDFDIGYIQGSTVVRIRSKEDISELWANVRKPSSKMSVWCDVVLPMEIFHVNVRRLILKIMMYQVLKRLEYSENT